MDFAGLISLMDDDFSRFQEQYKSIGDMSLEDLKKSFNEWFAHYGEAREKYKDLSANEVTKDASLFAAKTSYFFLLSNISLVILRMYADRLKQEYDRLKSKKRVRNTRRTKKSRFSRHDVG